MLALTDSASNAIRELGARPELPDGIGIRISARADGSDGLVVAPTATPKSDDDVVESQGAQVFLDPAVAGLLDDMVLDATFDTNGRVRFVLASSMN